MRGFFHQLPILLIDIGSCGDGGKNAGAISQNHPEKGVTKLHL